MEINITDMILHTLRLYDTISLGEAALIWGLITAWSGIFLITKILRRKRK